jgi:hypothetical protein
MIVLGGIIWNERGSSQYIFFFSEITAPPFIFIAILIFLYKKWMVWWGTGPPTVETVREGIQSHLEYVYLWGWVLGKDRLNGWKAAAFFLVTNQCWSMVVRPTKNFMVLVFERRRFTLTFSFSYCCRWSYRIS